MIASPYRIVAATLATEELSEVRVPQVICTLIERISDSCTGRLHRVGCAVGTVRLRLRPRECSFVKEG